jgi:hypothetical protein
VGRVSVNKRTGKKKHENSAPTLEGVVLFFLFLDNEHTQKKGNKKEGGED